MSCITRAVQFELKFGPWGASPKALVEDWLRIGGKHVKLRLIRNRRARRYVLRLRRDGSARVTIPRGGTKVEAKRFAEKNVGWLEKQLLRLAARPQGPPAWHVGTEILFRGERVKLQPHPAGDACMICLATETVRVKELSADLRPEVERFLFSLAARELPNRAFELAALHKISVERVTVRNQRSRWGSCSRRGTISINWRLLQVPRFVSDYIILHELAHLRHMNHSARFWNTVASLCPECAQAEKWIKERGREVLGGES